MSASYSPKDEWAYVGAVQSKESVRKVQQFLVEHFDFSTALDIVDIAKEMQATKIFRRYCFARLLMAPVELLMVYVLLGKSEATILLRVRKEMWRFLRGKVSRSELSKSAQLLPL